MILSRKMKERAMSKIIVAKSGRNPNFAQIHVHSRLLGQETVNEFFMPIRDSSESYLAKLPEHSRNIVTDCDTIPGIARIQIHLHEISIHFGATFNWDEDLSEQVLPMIIKHLGYDASKVTIELTTMEKLFPGC